MERKRSRLYGAMAAAGLLVLILDSRLAVESAREGMELCIRTVIPSLFPFFVLSMVLTSSLGDSVSRPVRACANCLGIPDAAASVLLPAVFGGYPVGAKCVGELYQSHRLSGEEAQRLLAFCSNAGPSFLFGMVSGFFPEQKMVWMLWLIHLFSAILTAMAIPHRKNQGNAKTAGEGSHREAGAPVRRNRHAAGMLLGDSVSHAPWVSE